MGERGDLDRDLRRGDGDLDLRRGDGDLDFLMYGGGDRDFDLERFRLGEILVERTYVSNTMEYSPAIFCAILTSLCSVFEAETSTETAADKACFVCFLRAETGVLFLLPWG